MEVTEAGIVTLVRPLQAEGTIPDGGDRVSNVPIGYRGGYLHGSTNRRGVTTHAVLSVELSTQYVNVCPA
jgi:hypothetical protein